ncbi:protein of unknown function [Noviherbaspirillum humi]|uniref:DUF4136 domain-containing protein n=1 Tax=Noviherbaspirillum humi TaxID=1688639 RepID=A0A239E992_9BURK|nr:DUF4136 domain-containing protein [Noviherbaspirillum humi]SNS41049.1 protein of unknown function [Noviherbaspirillum humi]
MKRAWIILSLMVLSLMAGCASQVVRTNVTAFHELPADFRNKTYVFERTAEQNNNLEYRNYENQVRSELSRLGFAEAQEGRAPDVKVTLNYAVTVRDLRVIEPVVVGSAWPGPFYPHPYWRGYYGPFYDPFWYSPPIVEQRDTTYQIYNRQLKIVMADIRTGKRLYENTVVSEGTNPSLAAVMPYMIRSAFADFPGPNSVPRQVELKMQS